MSHTLGYSFDDCNYKSGHGSLDSDETEDLKTFTCKAKDNRGQFQNCCRGGNDNRDITTNINPTGNATSAIGEHPPVPLVTYNLTGAKELRKYST